MFLLRLSLALLLLALGLGYLFQPKTILRFNAHMRDWLFNDARVLLNNRKIGILLVLTSFLAAASSLKSLR